MSTSHSSPRLRCAVYTRKSTEEGLEQEFNSLDAQREACTAYIASQVGLGWKLLPDHYDDAGISGGTMERPALQRLLQDIRDKRVDVVVVYKIDRLTRSLADFSKIVEVFDASSVSFVSVTQQFNTTTSMGRLTLNVLLSFAQFEREVTAERIRDKISASKKKGMWMGGVVSLGYRVENRKLIIDEAEAVTVRHLFDRYLKLGSVRALAEEAETTGLAGRIQTGSSSPNIRKPFGRGNLYHLLSNPIYIGKIRHRDQIYDGEHLPLLDHETFAKAQKLLAEKAPPRAAPTNRQHAHLLTGIVFDETGDRLSPSHAKKDGRQYRYYVSNRLMEAHRKGSDGWRIPAPQLESLVERHLAQILSDRAQLADWILEAGFDRDIEQLLAEAERLRGRHELVSTEERRDTLRTIILRVELSPGAVVFKINRQAVIDLIYNCTDQPARPKSDLDRQLAATWVIIPVAIKRRGAETKLVVSNGASADASPDPALIHLIGRAHTYLAKLNETVGRTLTEVAVHCQTDLSEVSRILPLAFLAPSITESIMLGRQPTSLSAQRLLRWTDLPHLWADQQAVIG